MPFAQLLISGVLTGLLFALIAIGMSLIFGVMHMINFAHGEFLMVAMYMAYGFFALTGRDPLLALPLITALMFIFGLLVYFGAMRKLVYATEFAQIFGSFGLSVLLQGLAYLLFSADRRTVNPSIWADPLNFGDIAIGGPELVTGLGSLLAVLVLFWTIERTEFGVRLKACAQDREAATVMGIDTNQMFALIWGIGSACVAVGGTLLSRQYPVFPDVGAIFGMLSFVVIALGGFGNIHGALYGGIAIGILSSFAGFVIDPSLSLVPAYLIYVAVVMLRSQGRFLWLR